ncbi:site-specific integrase [Rhizobium sp. NXC24]|uniref:site-specific integrase n=1 Tax=Rhizobium sp. NXC24 TaxID=2048897 RepID=UPI000CF1DA61|nr:site-specific integrase [Rhizobium sp. NXC24]
MADRYRLYRHPNGIYYHRVKVPAEIRSFYGKQIEQRSLRTRDLRTALRLLSAVIVEVDHAFALIRAKHFNQLVDATSGWRRNPTIPVSSEMMLRARDEFRCLLQSKEDDERALALRAFGSGGAQREEIIDTLFVEHRQRLEHRLASVERAYAVRDLSRWQRAYDHFDLADADPTAAIGMLYDCERTMITAWLREFSGPCSGMSLRQSSSDVRSSKAPEATARETELPLLSVIAVECFESLAKSKGWSAKTQSARANQIKQVIAICGDKPLNQYVQSDIRLLKSTLFELPPQAHGRSELKGLSKLEIAARAKIDGSSKGLSVESVRQVMTAMNLVFGWARAEFDINLKNIVQPMIPKLGSAGDRRDKRHGFSILELQKLFHSPVFTGVKSAREWFVKGDVPMQATGRFWVPLLSLYAGTRLMEAVQLFREDVRLEGGIWFLDVNADDTDGSFVGKTLKTMFAARKIPVHAKLIELGFVKFVQSVQPGQRLFPDIGIGPANQRHRHASKLFNKLLSKAGIKAEKKVWHSLRHSFEQACRDSRVDSAVMDQIQGHSQGIREVYGSSYGLPVLNEGIQSIAYKGLDLTHVRGFPS